MALALPAMPTLTACGPSIADRCAEARNPAECAQVAKAGGNVSDYLLYGMAGYMLSSAINGSGKPRPLIVADPHYPGYRRPIPSYQASRDYVRRSVTTTTTTKRGIFGGTRTVTRTTSVTSRPGFSRSTYRSSFSSRRR